jgi:putative endonuclease
MSDPRRGRGAAGEDAAAELLATAGYDLVARNFRTRYGELDIVAVDDDWLVFCEVRTRVGRPAKAIPFAKESVGPGKRLQLRKMAAEWFRIGCPAGLHTRRTRFDVVAVALAVSGRVLATEHVRGAF